MAGPPPVGVAMSGRQGSGPGSGPSGTLHDHHQVCGAGSDGLRGGDGGGTGSWVVVVVVGEAAWWDMEGWEGQRWSECKGDGRRSRGGGVCRSKGRYGLITLTTRLYNYT